jgi:hypothetical protein
LIARSGSDAWLYGTHSMDQLLGNSTLTLIVG